MSQDQRKSKFNILRGLFMSAAKKKKATGKTTAKKTNKKTTAKKVAKKAAKTAKKTKAVAKPKAAKPTSKKTAVKKNAVKKTTAPKGVAKASKASKIKPVSAKKTKAESAVKKVSAKAPKLDKKAKAVSAKVSKKTTAPKESAKPKKATKAVEVKEVSAPKVDPKSITEGLVKVESKAKIADVLLTDAEGRVLCRFAGCDAPAVVESYCRYHYLLNWKKIQLRKKILAEGKLENYINELTARYPDKYLEMMKSDLKSEKDFLAAVQELEIDDPDAAMSDSDAENYLEEVRGIRGDNRGSSEDDY